MFTRKCVFSCLVNKKKQKLITQPKTIDILWQQQIYKNTFNMFISALHRWNSMKIIEHNILKFKAKNKKDTKNHKE